MIKIEKIQYSFLVHKRISDPNPHKFYEQYVLYNDFDLSKTGLVQAWGPIKYDEFTEGNCIPNQVTLITGDSGLMAKSLFRKIREKQNSGYVGYFFDGSDNLSSDNLTRYYDENDSIFSFLLGRLEGYKDKCPDIGIFTNQIKFDSSDKIKIKSSFSKELMEMEAFGSW